MADKKTGPVIEKMEKYQRGVSSIFDDVNVPVPDQQTMSQAASSVSRSFVSNNSPVNNYYTVDNTSGSGAEPWLKLLSSYDKVTCKFIFTIAKFMEVMELLRPQNKNPKDQIRLAFVKTNRMLPIRMRFEVTVGQQMIKSEIDFALPKVNI